MVIIDRIVELAKERGIKLSYLAGLFGLGRTYFQDVKKRNANIPDERLFVIAEKLETTPEYLKGETDVKEKPSGNTTEGPITPKDQIINEIVKHLKSSSLDEVKRFDRMLDAFLADRQK